jgi:hypothetical protein
MIKIMKSVIVPMYTGFLPTVSEIGAAKNALESLSTFRSQQWRAIDVPTRNQTQ